MQLNLETKGPFVLCILVSVAFNITLYMHSNQCPKINVTTFIMSKEKM